MPSKLPPFPEVKPDLLDEWDYELNGELDPWSLTAGTNRKVHWKCRNNPDHKWEAVVSNRIRLKRGCPFCNKRSGTVAREKSMGVLFPDLLEEWDHEKNSDIDPFSIPPGSARRVWWKCNHSHEWSTLVKSRTDRNAGCPECRKIENNLATIHPELAEEWHPSLNGDLAPADVTEKSGKVVWWKCSHCLYEWKAKVVNRSHLQSGCPLCSTDSSVLNNKINKIENIDNFEHDYDYEDELVQLQDDQIHDMFAKYLAVEQETRSVDSVLSPRMASRIDYSPYYQRNYVWDVKKATYFIESILIGTEIPPLIFYFTNSGYEIIDGRQRFETVRRFVEGEIALSGKGLYELKSLSGKRFQDLPDAHRDFFLDSSLRVVKLKIVDKSKFNDYQEDKFKKEIFRRYNSGITPLRRYEVDKAVYIKDEPTLFFKNKFSKNKNLFKLAASLFLSDRDNRNLEADSTVEKLLQSLRLLLVSSDMPIGSTRKTSVVEQFYERFTESITNIIDVYGSFINKVKYLSQVSDGLSTKGVSVTRYWNECLYWGLGVMDREGVEWPNVSNESEFLSELERFYIESAEAYEADSTQFLHRRHVYRFEVMAKFLGNSTDADFSVYLASSRKPRIELKERLETQPEDEVVRIEKQEALPHSIEDICRIMKRGRFLVRPPYQRGEVINRSKSSAIIESILLGIKLPPLFIYRREDGVQEVVDGQQRILSILGYMGEPFLSEKGENLYSKKNNYKLSGLRILKELNGMNYESMDVEHQDKILDYTLSLINIDQKLNQEFDPVDLFVRLNSRPYPIKENTFEMWNSYVSKNIIDSVKYVANKYGDWVYITKNNVRMRNEELLAIVAYLEYRMHYSEEKDSSDLGFVEIISRESGVGVRLKEKAAVSRLLNKATVDEEVEQQVLKSVKHLESFLRKIRTILIDGDDSGSNDKLDVSLTKLFNVYERKYYARKLQDFYGLWFVSYFLSPKRVLQDRNTLREELEQLFFEMKTLGEENEENKGDRFRELVREFRKRYESEPRRLWLTRKQIEDMISQQKNKCPLCGGKMYSADDIEVDHKDPLALGGADKMDNLQVVHAHCNRSKGTLH